MSVKFERSHIIGLLVSLSTFLIVAIIFKFTSIFVGMELSALDFRYWLRDPGAEGIKLKEGDNQGLILLEGSATINTLPNPKARNDIYIIGIDENTVRYFDTLNMVVKGMLDFYKENGRWANPVELTTQLDWIYYQDDQQQLQYRKVINVMSAYYKRNGKIPDEEYLIKRLKWKDDRIIQDVSDVVNDIYDYMDIATDRIRLEIAEIKKIGIEKEDVIRTLISQLDLLKTQWPYHWNFHVQLSRNLKDGDPLAVFFDIMFLDHKPGEDELAEAIEQSGVTFLDFPFETRDVDTDYKDQSLRNALWDQFSFPANPGDNYQELVEEAVPPTPKLIKAAKGIGFANIFENQRDKVNRTMPLILKYKGRYYPNIDLLLVMHYYGVSKEDVEIKIGEYIKLKNIPYIKRDVGGMGENDIMAKPNDERSITIPIDEHGMMDVNFIGGHRSYNSGSYKTYLSKGILKNSPALKNKIVLVGAYASTGIATDIKKSPYGETFGIEHHAHALNTILNQDFLYKFSDEQNLLVLLLIALIIGIIVPRISIVKASISVLAFVLLYIFGSYIVLFEYFGIVNAMATPIIQTGLTFTTIISYRYMTEQKEKKYIRSTFSKFVSKAVVDDLLKNPEKLQLGGEKKVLTVLFSDIRGFTSISEKLTPEELVEHLNVYLQKMTDIVFKYDGTLDKYVGDEIMAFWGAPVPQEEHALYACKAALEMMEELAIMNDLWKKQDKPPLDIGIGLNSGDMVVGNMGSSSRMDYTLMGDNVNLGARLEGTNKVYRTNIIISEFTYEQVKDRAVVRELDLIRVKGKELPVKIYELLDILV